MTDTPDWSVPDRPPSWCAVRDCRLRGDVWHRTVCPATAVDVVRLKGIEVSKDEGPWDGDVRWDAQVPLCADHHHKRWFPVITAEGELTFETFGLLGPRPPTA